MEIRFNDVSYDKYLKNINFCFNEQNINTIMGYSEQEKELLLSIFTEFNMLSKGKIIIDNKDATIGVSRQDYFEKQNVYEELSYVLDKHNYKQDKDKHIKDALKMVHIDNNCLKQNPLTLSQSEKVLLSLARVLILNPKIIVLDEPSLYLDKENKDNLVKILRLLKNRFHKTIIIFSKDIEFIHKLSNNIYIIHNGKVVYNGNKYEVFTNEELLLKYHIDYPNVISFSKDVLKNKNIKMGYRDDINDLLKDIYRFVR